MEGPAIALVFQNAGPERARATLGAFFAVGYAASVAALAWTGVFGATNADGHPRDFGRHRVPPLAEIGAAAGAIMTVP